MSLSRSPSPVPGGGWSSPGLNINSGRSSPSHLSATPVAWESAKMRNHNVNGYPSFSTQNSGFFVRNMRRLSSTLPVFSSSASHTHKDGSGGDRWVGKHASWAEWAKSVVGRMRRVMKLRQLIPAVLLFSLLLFFSSCEWSISRSLRRWTFGLLTTATSHPAQLETIIVGDRGREVCHHPRCKRRWRCDGLEGCPGVGDRAR